MLTRIVVALITAFLLNGISNGQTNIIQIIADDMGWTDLSTGATNLGNPSGFYQTPNLEALAASGMSFTSAYVQPSCAPTRAALLTGQYAPRNGLHTVGSLSTGNQTLLVPPEDGTGIISGATTIAELMQSAGYITGHVGKFHATTNSNQITTRHGFDFNIGGTTSGGPNGTTPYFAEQAQGGAWVFGSAHGPELDIYASPYTASYIAQNLLPFANGNTPASLVDTPKHLNDAMADAAVDFLQQRAADGNPFFLNVAFNAVHIEINSRSDLEAKYTGAPGTPSHSDAGYAGLLEGMDQAIGRITQFIESSGLSGDTLIVFISDNGPVRNLSGALPLSGSKGSFLEGGIRVPLIVCQPGVVAPGTISSEAIHAVDLYKTYAEMAGVELPDPAVHPLDGESFAGLLTGQKSQLDRDSIFYHFPGYANSGTRPLTMAIHDAPDGNRYKMTYRYETRSFQFYDITNDISESNELVESGMTNAQFAIASSLSSEMNDWLIEVNALKPVVRETGSAIPGIEHTPAVRFDLSDSGFGGQLQSQSMATVQQSGISMTIEAVGQNALFSTSNAGLGVVSDLDTGTPNQNNRIDGSLSTAERIIVSFDRDVVLKSTEASQFSSNGAEVAMFEFVSGENPFVDLSGYDSNGFMLLGPAMSFTRSDNGNGNFEILMGTLDQDELLLRADTQIAITANPVTQGGMLLSSIAVAIPDFLLGDVNTDGTVDLIDVAPFIDLILTGQYQFEADLNSDGAVDLLDVAPFIDLLLN